MDNVIDKLRAADFADFRPTTGYRLPTTDSPWLGRSGKKRKGVPPGTTETRKARMNREWEMRRSDPGFPQVRLATILLIAFLP